MVDEACRPAILTRAGYSLGALAVLVMATTSTTPTQAAARKGAPVAEELAVEFLFNGKAPPASSELALLASIFPDVLAEMRSLLDGTKEN